MQGDCTWADGAPYVYSYWPADDSPDNTLEYQIFKEGHLMYNYSALRHNKSIISHIVGDVFCVGSGILPDNSVSHWIPIACHMSYLASFFCASNVKLSSKTRNTGTIYPPTTLDMGNANLQKGNSTTTRNISTPICPSGWIMINVSCFYMHTVSSRVTFIEAENICQTSQARIPLISQPYLGHSMSYEESNSTILTRPMWSALKYLDHYTDALKPTMTSKLQSFQTKYKEMMLGFRLIATEDNLNLVLLLQMIGNILHFRSNILIRGPEQQCFILEFDTYLSNMLPDLQTMYGKSLSGWILIEQRCSSKYYVLPLVCTKDAIATAMACSGNQYKCSDESCILLIYRCDGFNDCIFSEDEVNCLPDVHPSVSCFSFRGEYSEIMIPFHSLCDGLTQCEHGTDESFCMYNQIENDIQKSESISGKTGNSKQARLKQQQKLEKLPVSRMKKDLWKYSMRIFWERLKNYKLPASSVVSQPNLTYNRGFNIKWWPFYMKCTFSDDTFLFDNLCKHKRYGGTICGMGTHLQYCENVKCSGMFKCRNSFCIELGDVCDGKADCANEEDEMFCNNLSCPGMLRCRGETRCVPPWKLCDGHAECQITFDDETSCNRCLKHCECEGRSSMCETAAKSEQHALFKFIKTPNSIQKMRNEKLQTSQMKSVTHLKIKSRDNIECLNYNVLNPSFSHIIKLDISHCRLKSIDNIILTNHKQIAFLNVSHNRLFSPDFLTTLSDLPLHHLDISYNEFVHIETPESQHLKQLEFFRLTNNKISHLKSRFIGLASNVTLLDLRHNPIQYVSLRFVRALKYLYVLDVTDIEICCIFPSSVKCSWSPNIAKYTLNIRTCQTFITSFPLQLSSQLILIVSILITVTSLILNLSHVKVKTTKLPVTYLNINISLSGFISICFVITVFLDDNTIKRKPTAYVKSMASDMSCIFKQIFCLLMLQMDVYLLIIKSYSILSRIKYPFQHQCQWLRFINVICILLWMIAAGISTIITIVHYSILNTGTFLKSCHILAESKNNTFDVKIVSLAYSIFYLVTLVTYIYIMANFHITLRQSMLSTVKHSSKRRGNMNTTIVMTSIEIFLLLSLSVTIFIPYMIAFTRNAYIHFFIFVVLIKTLSKDILHSLHPRFNRT